MYRLAFQRQDSQIRFDGRIYQFTRITLEKKTFKEELIEQLDVQKTEFKERYL
jgi:hypothetical protein